jgi:hypothetical protein
MESEVADESLPVAVSAARQAGYEPRQIDAYL